jgi:hypothetical protein
LHCLQREFPQLAVIFHRVREKVAFCNVAKQALGEASWEKTSIVRLRQLLEPDSLGGPQEAQDILEKVGRLEATRSVVILTGYLHPILPSF